MNNDDKDLMNRLFTLAENYAGINQALKDLVNQVGSYREDITTHKDASARRHAETLDKLSQNEKETQQEIRRLVDGMNKKIETNKEMVLENSDKIEKRIIELESDKKGVKWVFIVLGSLIASIWALIVKNWQYFWSN